MSFPRYKRYKDSGVEWLGEVPEHWQARKLGSVAAFRGGGTPAKDNLAFWNGEIPWVSPKDMKGESIERTEDAITEAGLASSTTSLIPAGAVLMVVRSGILKHTIPVAINRIPVTLNQDMKAIVIDPAVGLSEFFLRWVQGLNELLLNVWLKQGATVESVEHSYLSNTDIPFPPLIEQQVICRFLQVETEKLDSLAEEQRRLIELLKEKRLAVISHAVTKGLDPKPSLTSSGASWIGAVPSHWRVERAGHLFVERDERSDLGNEEMLTVSHLTGVTPRSEKTVYMFEAESNEGYKKVYPGDLVINTLWAWMGAMGVSQYSGIVSPAYHVYRPRLVIHPDYVNALVRVPAFAREASRWSKGVWSSRLRLYPQDMFQILFPVPPLEEQRRISQHIREQDFKMSQLIQESEKGIALLQERRTASISAAVTGKIDVRNCSPKETA